MKGCECKEDSKCDADLGTGFRCDTCKTKGSCGSWSPLGRWDYCDYRPLTVPIFTSQSYSSKLDYYWSKVIANSTRYPEYPLLSNLPTSIRTTFDNYRPEMPTGRQKMIHTTGSVCKVELDIKNSPYTGILGNGVQKGLIRMGGALDPTLMGPGLTPGLGFKFPRTGVPDGDFVMLYSLEWGDQWNFFLNNQSTHLEPVGGPALVLVVKFREGTQCPYQVGISDLARYSQDGTEHTPKFPFKLFMVPNTALKTGEGAHTVDAVHAELDAIPKGTTLYTTYACQEPAGDEMKPTEDLSKCGKPLLLGDVVTTSECTTSWYGDTSLHIRHQRIEEDWKLEPSYSKWGQYDAGKACNINLDPDYEAVRCEANGMLETDAAMQ